MFQSIASLAAPAFASTEITLAASETLSNIGSGNPKNGMQNIYGNLAIVGSFVIALWLKGLWLSWIQVYSRVRTRSFAKPEDAAMLRQPVRTEPAIVANAAQAWANEHESTAPFFGLALIAALLGAEATFLAIVCSCFALSRFGHGWAQVHAAQPQRTLFWLSGFTATIVMAANMAWFALRHLPI